uniref:Uncharacterized protein n=1 Tax=Arundo donax TaxID=35708 RepID=A0A0A8ZQ10_ARUDO
MRKTHIWLVDMRTKYYIAILKGDTDEQLRTNHPLGTISP